jgi:cytoskeleton protein RodZ
MLQDRRSNLAEGRNMMSSVGHGYETTVARPGVGSDLRAARERLGWTLPAISEKLRIRLPFLEAIEDGRIGELPGNAYAVGFLRMYASAVGLDADEISRRFRAEAADVNRKTELAFPAPVPERGVPAGAVVLLGVVVVVLAYAGWYRFSGDRRATVEQIQPVPDRLATLAPVTPPAPVPAAPARPVTPPSPAVTDTAPVPRPVIPTPILVPIPPIPVAAAPSTPAPVVSPDGTRIVLRAKSEAWVQISDKQGNVVLNRTFRAGETWPVPPKQALFLTVGNAGGTELLVDGVVAPSLGADGVVRRNLPLDADQVRDGKLAVTAPTVPTPPPGAPARPPAPRQP